MERAWKVIHVIEVAAPRQVRSRTSESLRRTEITLAKLYWETTQAADFQSLLDLVPDDALNSPRRSVVPLLDFCRVPNEALARLSTVVDPSVADATDMIFEHPVPVQQGRGKSSFTDLLILTPKAVVAVEAKYTEPEYESVQSWLGEGKPNRQDVLQGWLNLLGKAAGRPIRVEEVQGLPYQLIHRAASACHSDRAQRSMIYLVFGEAAPHYSTHIESLRALLGSCVSLAVASCTLTKSQSYKDLERRWDSGERQMAVDVRRALREGPLFQFGSLNVRPSHGGPSA